jgi:hypothetical protein
MRLTKRNSKKNFILEQGLRAPDDPGSASMLYAALQFQPRLIGALVLIGVGFQAPELFLALGAALLCSALAPRWNPFNALYNYPLGSKRGSFLLRSAPPRIFAEAMAGCLAVTIGALLARGHDRSALLLEGVFVLANAAVVFRQFCFGAFLFSWFKNRLFGNRVFFRRIFRRIESAGYRT